MNIADSVDRSRARARTRTLLTLLAVTTAVIVGLLAMHSLGSGQGHDAAPMSHAASMGETHAATASTSEGATAATGCMDCGGGNADMLVMACILAILALVMLLAPRSAALLRVVRDRAPTVALLAPGRRPTLATPSLSVLCVSRT
ncbi:MULTISPECIES: DUF6153 family protein [unclassified Microbacterium]|uniref:DUF6153 family protein n=1 Tax=unclassified Microbacterium TaxID=2609290 RepID=UPI003C2D3E6C